MDKKNLMPHQVQPITRITTGQLSAELAELSEEALSYLGASDYGTSGASVRALALYGDERGESLWTGSCSYDGDDAE